MTYRHVITARYVLALTLVALVLTGAYATLMWQLEQNSQDGRIINISGQQRMLSQRTALLIREITLENHHDTRRAYMEKLEVVVSKMRGNHAELVDIQRTLKNTPLLDEMYFSANGVDARMTMYLMHVDDFMTTFYQSGGISPALNEFADDLAAIARNGFIQQLDDVVQQYEHLFEANMQRFKAYETAFVAVGILLLVFEALWIFRPMAKKIDHVIGSLKQSNQELKEFSFRISHDLRAPVASSIGMLSIAKEAADDNDKEELDFALARIETSMETLDKTIVDIVNVTRAGLCDTPSEVVSVSGVLESVVEKLSAMPGFEQIRLQTEVTPSDQLVTRKLPFALILENLISNAVKYADVKKTSPQITVSVSQRNGETDIDVIDNGVGIPEEYRKDLFGMFKRFHPDMSFGTGLGLYLVKQSATSINGRITYKPLDTGSQFTLSLPS